MTLSLHMCFTKCEINLSCESEPKSSPLRRRSESAACLWYNYPGTCQETTTMIELIKTNLELCVGCNRCIRECPAEMANITYQDEAGNIKVKTDYTRCINCGWCVSVCKHGARSYKDDTERFFEDLDTGVSLSLIVAPSVRANIPEYKRLLTYLKNRGIKMIYDVSLGADICIWAHIRYFEKNGFSPLITQPCPAIVLYCEKYRQDLLEKLSPIHSPMACTAIYMKEYKGITDRIAALSPCIAKSNEFAATQLVQYNVTFAQLQKYLDENKVELPMEETEFDHEESGLGVLFPMPGGLKENLEFYFGKQINVSRAEGPSVYAKLNTYAETPTERLPDIFDVLSCAEGCNIGSAVACKKNRFEVESLMRQNKNAVTDIYLYDRQNRPISIYSNQNYDSRLELSRFTRKYRLLTDFNPVVTEKDIEDAFARLGKGEYEKQHVDCGACGSETCYNMARKIALGVNIPTNCLVKTKEDAQREHEENVITQKRFAYLESMGEADERMRIMLDTTPVSAQFWDKNLRVIDCNQETLRLFKAASKEEYLERFYDHFPEYQPDGSLSKTKALKIIKQAFKEGYMRFEWMCQTLDGTPLPTDVTLVRVDYKGDHRIAAYTRDLREQRQMMQELDNTVAQLKAANEALQLTQQTMSSMFEANPHINILFNSKFEIVDCNPIALKLMKFSSKAEMLVGFADRLIESVPASLSDGRPVPQPIDVFRTAVAEGLCEFETELIVLGERRCLNVKLVKVPYGNSFALVAYLVDVTNIQERERELAHSREQIVAAESASQAKTDFLSSMSHEIRTPMNAILGITEILLHNGTLSAETTEALGKIHNAGDLLLGIINDILDLSKIEAGKLEISPAEYEVASLINDVVILNMMLIGSKNINFQLSVDPDTPAILLGDVLRIKQILNNLLSNAVKYTEKGTVQLSVSSEPSLEGEVMLVFKVTDTGLGMTPEQTSQLFDRYVRFHEGTNRAIEGVGLGMNITKNLVHMMNGEILVVSEINKGSEFTVRLPQNETGSDVLGDEQVASLQNFRIDGKKQMRMAQVLFESMPDARILVVDDVESNLYVAQGLLAPYGVSVDTVSSGFEAIDKIKEGNEYDIIFMDHMMPKMDGMETTKIIRDLGYKLPIVALTANAVTGQSEIFLSNSFDGFIPKPIDVRLLNAALKKFVQDKLSSGIFLEAARRHKETRFAGEGADLSTADPQLIESFLRDVNRVMTTLESIYDKRSGYTAEDMRDYIVNVHAIKSALAYIGEREIFALAEKLEQAGRKKDTATMAAETPILLDALRTLVEKFTPQEKYDEQRVSAETVPVDWKYLRERLLSLNEACENFDIQIVDEIIAELREKVWSRTIEEELKSTAEHVLCGNFEEVVRTAEKILETIT